MEKSQKKPHRYKARIISGFTTLLLLVAVVCCLYIVLQSMSAGYVKVGGASLFRVVTGSMEPSIPEGTVLLAQETDIRKIRENDVVCFISENPGSEGLVVTHRVTKVRQFPDGTPFLMTKGDSNPTEDIAPVTQSNLIGRVTWHTGDGSSMAMIVNFITSKVGFIACIVLPVLLIAVWVFRDAAKNLKKEIQQVEERLQQQEKQKREKAMSAAEYEAMYERIKNEVRKEMEQHAETERGDTPPVEQDDTAPAAAPSEAADSAE